MLNLLWVGLGGFLGVISRYGIFQLTRRWYHQNSWPLGTLIVNILGSFLIGLALGWSIKSGFNLKYHI